MKRISGMSVAALLALVLVSGAVLAQEKDAAKAPAATTASSASTASSAAPAATATSAEPAASTAKSAAPAAAEYAVKFLRPVKVGEAWEVAITGSKKQGQTILLDGVQAGQKKEEFQYEAAGTVEVLGVDGKGRPTKVSFTVTMCALTVGDKKSEPLAAGKVVIIESKDGKIDITPKDSADTLSPEATAVVASSINVQKRADGASDDEVMGTTKKQKAGDSWDINAALAQTDLAKDLGATIENAKGKVTLTGVTKVDGVECLNLATQISFKIIPADKPAEVKIEKSEFKFSGTQLLPTDLALPLPLKQETANSVSLVYKAQSPEGKEMILQISSEETRKDAIKMKKK